MNRKGEGQGIFGTIFIIILIWGLIGMFATFSIGTTCKMGISILCFSWEKNELGLINDFFNSQSNEMKGNIDETLRYLENPNSFMEEAKETKKILQENFESENQECILKVKELVPKKITLWYPGGRDEMWIYDEKDNPEFRFRTSCTIMPFTELGIDKPGDNTHCGFSFDSGVYSIPGERIIGSLKFQGTIIELEAIPHTTRVRYSSKSYEQKTIQDFIIKDISLTKCEWAEELKESELLPIKVTNTELIDNCNNECDLFCDKSNFMGNSSLNSLNACICNCYEKINCGLSCTNYCEENKGTVISFWEEGDYCKCECNFCDALCQNDCEENNLIFVGSQKGENGMCLCECK